MATPDRPTDHPLRPPTGSSEPAGTVPDATLDYPADHAPAASPPANHPLSPQDRQRIEQILQQLAQAPWEPDFRMLLRRIECAAPGLPRIARATRPADEPIRLGQAPHLHFAPAELADLQKRKGYQTPWLVGQHFGLLGPNGPMPHQFTQHVRERLMHHADPAILNFLDMFHHRLLSLFYRAWAVNQPVVWADRPHEDRFARYVGSIVGLGTKATTDTDHLPQNVKLHWAGRLACPSHHAEGLEAILATYFNVPASVLPMRGAWLRLPPSEQLDLGRNPAAARLGQTAVVGGRVWSITHAFRIRIGPVGLLRYEQFLPGGRSLSALVAWVRQYAGFELEWDLQLVLERRQVPPARLGSSTRLGFTSWLTTRTLPRDADDLALRAERYVPLTRPA